MGGYCFLQIWMPTLSERGLNRMFMVLKQWFFPAVLSLEMIILINNFDSFGK